MDVGGSHEVIVRAVVEALTSARARARFAANLEASNGITSTLRIPGLAGYSDALTTCKDNQLLRDAKHAFLKLAGN